MERWWVVAADGDQGVKGISLEDMWILAKYLRAVSKYIG